MKQRLPWIFLAVFALWALGTLRPPREETFHISGFAKLPMVFNGRVQPFDSLARNTLLELREKQTINLEPWKGWSDKPRILSAAEWLLHVMTKPEEADGWPAFRIDHPDLISQLKLPTKDSDQKSDGKHYSWNQISAGDNFRTIEQQANKIQETKKDASLRDTYDQAMLRLHSGMILYFRLKNTLRPQDAQSWAEDLSRLQKAIGPGVAAAHAQRNGQPYDTNALDAVLGQVQKIEVMTRLEPPLVVPPGKDSHVTSEWTRVGDALMNHVRGEPLSEYVMTYAKIADAFRAGRPADFNQAVEHQLAALKASGHEREVDKGAKEHLFNRLAPFYTSMVIYVAAFLLACGFWFNFAEWTRLSAMKLIWLGFVIHSVGLIFRMWLEGRPPVTNLYSSAIFIGWGSVVLGLVLEKFWRNAIGLVVASAIGFATLVIAHNLSLSGDTMVMLQAVLDTNFWLATHVVVVTLGYASTFVAGFLAIIYVLRGFFTKGLTENDGRSLARMVYGIVCFATLFSFVGTVLGGIWADQSWGRFWGWDPKENGALIIVLWNALILHARWGGLVRERGLMNLAIGGNIVTSWSWFGVNMLGVGLHSYGFMSGAFRWLAAFVISQLVLIALSSLPLRFWASFRSRPASTDSTGGKNRSGGSVSGKQQPAAA